MLLFIDSRNVNYSIEQPCNDGIGFGINVVIYIVDKY